MPAIEYAPPLRVFSDSLPLTPDVPRPGRRRVLIVSPHFPPINAPDHHRVRVALPHLAANGWEAEVLCVRPDGIEAVPDYLLGSTLPARLPVHAVPAWPYRWTRRLGWGSLSRRAYGSLRRQGSRLLATGRFDLVFFSTTQFGVMPLGPEWLRRFNVPYVLDFQDEWVTDYYTRHPQVAPPGGRYRFALSQMGARFNEARVVKKAAQVLSVSPDYLSNLQRRYPELAPERLNILPFAASDGDFQEMEALGARQDFFRPGRGTNWVYAGRGGPDTHLAMRAFLWALRSTLDASQLQGLDLKIHLIGTSYAPEAAPSYDRLIAELHLGRIVQEHPARVPYYTALRCLRDADALLVFGSDDQAYTPSKIFPYLLAGKPVLAVMAETSGSIDLLRASQCGATITFRPGQTWLSLAPEIGAHWFGRQAYDQTPPRDGAAPAPYRSAVMTARLTGIFNAAVRGAVPA